MTCDIINFTRLPDQKVDNFSASRLVDEHNDYRMIPDCIIMRRCYLDLTAVVGDDEAQQDDGGKADDGLECEGVDRALWATNTQHYGHAYNGLALQSSFYEITSEIPCNVWIIHVHDVMTTILFPY